MLLLLECLVISSTCLYGEDLNHVISHCSFVCPYPTLYPFFNPTNHFLLATLLEVVVFKDPATVHIYEVVEHGRRFYRSLAFTSDISFTYRDLQNKHTPKLEWKKAGGMHLSSGKVLKTSRPASPSMLISRHLDKVSGVQTFVPSRFLWGLLPHVLLERYDFWQNAAVHGQPTTIIGLERTDKPSTRLELRLYKDQSMDESGYGHSMAYCIVRRVNLVSKQVHTLLNPLYAPPEGSLKVLANLLRRLDNLSHVLLWTLAAVSKPNDKCSVDLVELPRVRLVFQAKIHIVQQEKKLYSMEYSGLFLTSKAIQSAFLQGLPHAVMLENEKTGELSMLIPASTLPLRPERPRSVFSSNLLLDRSNVSGLGLDSCLFILLPSHLSYPCI